MSLTNKNGYLILLFIFGYSLTNKSNHNLNLDITQLITITNTLNFLAAKSNHDLISPEVFVADFIDKLVNKKVDLTVPKIIHFIWVGGPIYEEYWLTITKMATIARANGYQLYVWVDNSRNLRSLKTYASRLKVNLPYNPRIIIHNDTYDHYVNKIRSVKIKSIYDLQNQAEQFKYFPSTFSREFWKNVQEEMIGLKNYAAASDLFRYLILFIYGGIYFDTDERIVSSIFEMPKIGTITLPYGFKNVRNTNSILLSIKRHPVLWFALMNSLKLYREISRRGKGAKRKPSGKMRIALTLEFTGPDLIKKAKEEFVKKLSPYTSEWLYIISDRLTLESISSEDLKKLLPIQVQKKRAFIPQWVFQIGEELLVQKSSDKTWLQNVDPRLVEQ